MLLCAAASLGFAAQPLAEQGQPKATAKSPVADPVVIDPQGFRDLVVRSHGKPLMAYFWATWCEPCRDEYPMVNELARKYAPQGLVIVGISLDDDAEITLVRHFLARTSPVFPNYRKRPGNEEAFVHAVNPKWSGAIPATFLYARDGRELTHLVGQHTREDFEKAIQALLGAAPKSNPLSGTRNDSGVHSTRRYPCCAHAETSSPGSVTAPSRSPHPAARSS